MFIYVSAAKKDNECFKKKTNIKGKTHFFHIFGVEFGFVFYGFYLFAIDLCQPGKSRSYAVNAARGSFSVEHFFARHKRARTDKTHLTCKNI